jgi:decaprenylphospho-beta-D-erythro-pentofuranosid-2-ulose 2-reductase
MPTRPVRAALLVGGSSDIGAAILTRLLPAAGADVVLAGRPSSRRRVVAGRLAGSHRVHELDWDAYAGSDPVALLVGSARLCGRPLDLVVIAVGALDGPAPDVRVQQAPRTLERCLTVNLIAPAAVMVAAVHHLAEGGGRLVVITSASATRPRRAIAGYSAAKQALDQLTRMVAATSGDGDLQVHVVRPGHVRTAMTRGLPEPPLTRDPDQVADDVARGVVSGRQVIWSPRVMGIAMAVLRSLPRPLVPKDLA